MFTVPRACVYLFSVCAVLVAQAGEGVTAEASPTKRKRGLSAEASAALSAGLKYQPVKEPELKEEEEDARETDKPRNEIIRLPKYIVNAKRPPVFRDRDLYQKGNLEKLAMSRYLSKFDRKLLNRWTIPLPGGYFSNEARAMEAFYAEERLQNMAAIRDQAAMYEAVGDSAKAAQIRDETYSTFIRVNEKPAVKLGKTLRY